MKSLVELYNICEKMNKYIDVPKLGDPIAVDAIDILSKIKPAVKVTKRKDFDKLKKSQKYFSASMSRVFNTADDFKNRIENDDSVITKDVGVLVAVWDDANSIGYIIPSDDTVQSK